MSIIKLIGDAPNQVSRNRDLGDLAYQDAENIAGSLTAGSINNTPIGSTTASTGAFTTLTSTNGASIQGLTVGRGAGAVNTNTAVGLTALSSNTTGLANDSFGSQSLFSNTTANENVGFGYQTLYSATTGGNNTALGSAAVRSVVSGSSNTGAGYRSLYATTGSNNTALGYNAGNTATTGSNNGFFGYNAQPSSVTVSNEYTYGNSAVTKHRFVGGDIVIGTAGKGIDFSADGQAAGMTSELLDDYEEGTWTPTQGAGLTVVGAFSSDGTYTKIGRQVTVQGRLIGGTSIAAASGAIMCGGVPFTGASYGLGTASDNGANNGISLLIAAPSLYAANAIPATTPAIRFGATFFV